MERSHGKFFRLTVQYGNLHATTILRYTIEN